MFSVGLPRQKSTGSTRQFLACWGVENARLRMSGDAEFALGGCYFEREDREVLMWFCWWAAVVARFECGFGVERGVSASILWES